MERANVNKNNITLFLFILKFFKSIINFKKIKKVTNAKSNRAAFLKGRIDAISAKKETESNRFFILKIEE